MPSACACESRATLPRHRAMRNQPRANRSTAIAAIPCCAAISFGRALLRPGKAEPNAWHGPAWARPGSASAKASVGPQGMRQPSVPRGWVCYQHSILTISSNEARSDVTDRAHIRTVRCDDQLNPRRVRKGHDEGNGNEIENVHRKLEP